MRRAIATAAMAAVIASVFALPAMAVSRDDNKGLGDQITTNISYDWRGWDYDIIGNAVDALGLEDTLNSAGPFTVFLPNDWAMKRLAYDLTGKWEWRESKVIPAILGAVGAEGATNVILYHAVPGASIDSTQALASDGAALTTAFDGQTFTVDVRNSKRAIVRLIDNADLRDPYLVRWDLDNFATNGVWHGISRVLVPDLG